MDRSTGSQSASRIVGAYLVFGLLWILLSDQALQALVSDPRQLTRLQTLKGWTYVLVTAGLIYWLVWREIRRYERLRVRSEASIRASEERYRTLIETAREGVWVLDRRARTSFVNPRLAELLGYGEDELLGRPLYDFLDAAAREAAAANFQRHALGVGDSQEFCLRRKDGQPVWALLATNPLYDPRGRYSGVLALATDITARKQAELALREAQARLVEAEANAHIGHWWMEADPARGGFKAYWADEIYRILDLDPALPAGPETLSRRVYPDDWGRVYASLMGTLDKGTESLQEYRILRPSGETRWVDCRGKVVRDADGKVHRVVGTFQDVTARKRAEAAIHELNTELEQRVVQRTAQLAALNQELETFAYTVSHDLKAPLRGIEGYGQLLEADHAGQLDAEGRQFLRNIRQGASQMNALIDDLLAYSRLERRSLNQSQVDLPALAQLVLAERAEDIRAWGVTAALRVPPLTAHADMDGLLFALRNLLDNALKFSRNRQAAEIELGARAAESGVQLWVKDNGIGFDMQFHDRIFEIFQRLQRSEEYPGTGIGLAIVRKAITRMGGRVWAESAPGEGATFFLELPAEVAP